jgi:hypothetical protein
MTATAFLLALPLLFAGVVYLACSVGTRVAVLVNDRETQVSRSDQGALLSTA